MKIKRCAWVPQNDELYTRYHDREWGVPVRSSRKLFEMLLLEGAQAGLSWRTVLAKREAYRELYAGFDPEKIAGLSDRRLEQMLCDDRIIRNRLKVYGFRKNAIAYINFCEKNNSFSRFLWSFVDGKPVQNRRKNFAQIPAETPAARAMSKALKQHGFTFVGPSICYAFMQACGLVNDHSVDCFCYRRVAEKGAAITRLMS